ncbi:hypothetical protein M6B38_401530 [Iris pallida]|uniref:Uncharacterized protein n=1 Tax=Iris pallida TaxID=29817 RepID=A0AAX6FTT8_IRIPA|nr:hypothetical protein M6B38_401530 [Iris pallida]
MKILSQFGSDIGRSVQNQTGTKVIIKFFYFIYFLLIRLLVL